MRSSSRTRPAGSPPDLSRLRCERITSNGTDTSPVAFLEGIYVEPRLRRKGIGAALVAAVCAWARRMGCRELASDALLENEGSHAVHRALGFEETERVVFFRKALAS